MRIGPCDHIKHQVQTGIAAHNGLLGLAAQNIRPVGPCAGQTGQLTVISGVDPLIHAVFHGLHTGQNILRHIQLQLGGPATGHIQLQALGFAVFKTLSLRRKLCHQFLTAHFQKTLHKSTSQWEFTDNYMCIFPKLQLLKCRNPSFV